MKIKKLVLVNFRGYEYEVFDFVDGLNTLIGTGDSGKSGALDAIAFVTENDQSGTVISTGILDAKGKILKGKKCRVEIHTVDGDVIVRERGRASNENIYQINDQEPIRNFNQDVPDEVKEILNLNDLNIQNQFDPHFLINKGASAGAVAKRINKSVNLDIIDVSISNIDRTVKKISSDKKRATSEVDALEREVEEYSFLEDMKKDVEEWRSINDLKNLRDKDHQTIDSILSNIKQCRKDLSEINTLIVHEEDVSVLAALYGERKGKTKEYAKLQGTLSSILGLKKEREDLDTMLNNETAITRLQRLFSRRRESLNSRNDVLKLLNTLKNLNSEGEGLTNIASYEEDVEELLSLIKNREEKEHKANGIEDIKNKIVNKEKKANSLNKLIIEESARIEGQSCPVCGGVL